ncbi:exodeoxyribonuclease VII small subunit [Scytonema sp. HK-05]|uniref:exodeoxyribonuclease VII small subunit n=1 Tax=Scytonema sp. HK-05 TaxID=1137095 RepID=UPI000936D5BE|nr:exodeoxyribonuclease VII small subunit [Scytonema sp. HK-05]OKH58117.1 exodeoxyribonuclease VII small subunit [Scytonema sp. HK-05]BAY47495.1 exodeoxyribonuclease VII small subunit [Scytonema sp. HK-05]
MNQGWNYEAKVAEVERIIARIEAGDLELEEVFDQFATAVESLRQCEAFLQERQQKVDLLIETLKEE